MRCDPLAYSGPGAPVSLLLILAVAFLLTGAFILLMTRRRGRIVAGALLLLTSAAAVSISAVAPGRAVADDCPPVNNSLTIVQTSVMEGLAPGTRPAPISGLVRNNGSDSTTIVAIDVRIIRVVRAWGSPAGQCDSSDFTLVNPRMPVGRTLGPGGSTTFAGASIGMRAKSVNQDACKAARIDLLYTANPS